MRILIALTYYRPHYSGLTIHAEREARALAARGHTVTVLTSRFNPSLPAREHIDSVEIIRPRVLLHISKGVIMPAMPYWAWKLVRKADVVHLHLPQLDAAPIALISRLMGKPVVVTYHCDLLLPHGFIHFLANQASDLANNLTGLSANLMVHNTRDYAETSPYLTKYLDKVRPIFPPVMVAPAKDGDVDAFRLKNGIQPGQQVIGMAARLASEKGAEYLAEALPLVLEKHPQARVLFVGQYQNVFGEEQYAARLAPMIEKLGGHWKFLGILPDQEFAAFLRACDVTVLPSLNSTESYGLVQVESMTCGTPVVASDLPGVRVPVQMSGMGILVPPANAQALAQALITILDNPLGYRKNPGAIVQLSTPEAVAAAYEAVFNEACQQIRVPRLK
jgi:glycosyltransferase involved in cell wall biosynthesis